MRDNKAFTLIELLVVVAIIGILAAVGVVAYNGYTSSAKASATKLNFSTVVKYVEAETRKCEIGATYIFENNVSCSASAGSNYVYQDANNMRTVIINFFKDRIKNPYTGMDGIVENGGIPNIEREIGEVHISPGQSPERLTFMICFKSLCSDANNRITKLIYLPN